jgi:hypothetical protein
METTLELLKNSILYHVKNYGTNHYIEICVGDQTRDLRFSDIPELRENLTNFLDTLDLRITTLEFGFYKRVLGLSRKK